jgi:hypothetical protein
MVRLPEIADENRRLHSQPGCWRNGDITPTAGRHALQSVVLFAVDRFPLMPDRDLTNIPSGRIAWTLSLMCWLVRVSHELG